MKKLLLSFFIFAFIFSSAQNPLVKQWDYRYGGTDDDKLTWFLQTPDGGYILVGQSSSVISGDKSQTTKGGVDYWIVKIDAAGIKQWDKDIGGTSTDFLNAVALTSDGGYILGGCSWSGIGGDKTQAMHGNGDYWIVKTDSLGTVQWDKDFGGTGLDDLYSIQQTSDGGYILGGRSGSGIGGDKTQATQGYDDYWIVKTDSLGIKQWDKDFGGDTTEFFYSIQQTSDGGYILGGYSHSGIGGDKTQASQGGRDYWMVKTDPLGIKQWDKDFGGAEMDWFFGLTQTRDDGYILAGSSYSGISGDKTEPVWGIDDFWIVKTDASGNKQWDKDYGGLDIDDYMGNISQTDDGGYLFSGNSYSGIGGDKSESNLGNSQAWVLKTDSLGVKQWDKTLHTIPDGKLRAYCIQTKEGCYAIAKPSYGSAAGDKTQTHWGISGSDYWIIKLCDSIHAPVSAFTSANHLCEGTCTNFLNLSYYATSYQWNFPGGTPDTSTAINPTNICYVNSGQYDVQLIAINANGSDTLLLSNYITVYPQPIPQSIIQYGDTLFAIAGASSYQWYYNNSIINGATGYFYVAVQSGDYNVVATDANGCEVEAVLFNVIAGVQSSMKGVEFLLSPNPVKDVLVVRSQLLAGAEIEITVYNFLGVKIYTSTLNKKPETINVEAFPPGIYFVKATSGVNVIFEKIIKQ